MNKYSGERIGKYLQNIYHFVSGYADLGTTQVDSATKYHR